MKPNPYEGSYFIVFEGTDGSGKTTAAEEAIKKLRRPGEFKESDICYLKGVGSGSFIGKIARRFPCTLLFCVELLHQIFWKIRPALQKGKIVFQDRYFFSIASHLPQADRKFNKMLLKITERFVIKPDLILYFMVSRDEQIKRLKKSAATNRFHKELINNPETAEKRLNKYKELIFDSREFLPIIINSTNIEPEKISDEVADIVRQFINFMVFHYIGERGKT